MPSRGPAVHTHAYHTHTVTRNPWGGAGAGASSSSGSSRTYHCPADCHTQDQEHWYSRPARTPSPHYDVIEAGPGVTPRLAAVTLGPSRPVTPASTAHTHTDGNGAVDPCGGHCTAFENFCHYCLQVLFIAGILTGVSLTVAGSVLRGPRRGGDLMVLVYIGCLTAMVCTLLLSVQCCVRRNVKRRKRQRGRGQGGGIPLVELTAPAPLAPPLLPPAPGQYEPLLRRLVQQQIHDRHDIAPRGDRSGTPWWRRQPPRAAQPYKPHPHQVPL